MKQTLRELKQTHKKNIGLIKNLNSLQEKRDLTESEQTSLETLFSTTEALKKEIEQRERVKQLELSHESLKDDPIQKENRQYSLKKALDALTGKRSLTGFEAEVSQELEKRSDFPGSGIVIPSSALFGNSKSRQKETRIVNNESALFSDPVRPEEIVPSLREQSLLGRLGMRMISVSGRFHFPKTTGAVAGWFSGTGSDSITTSDPDFSSVESRPKFLGVLTSWSLAQIKNQSAGIDLESILRMDLTSAMASELDRAIVKGSGTANQPRGITLQTGIGKTDKAYSATLAWTLAEILSEIENLRTDFKNQVVNPKWLISTKVAREWEETQKFSDVDQTLMDVAKSYGSVVVSNYLNQPSPLPENAIEVVLGQWDQFMLATYDSVMLEVGRSSDDFSKGIERLRAIGCYDLIMRRAEGFRRISIDRKA